MLILNLFKIKLKYIVKLEIPKGFKTAFKGIFATL